MTGSCKIRIDYQYKPSNSWTSYAGAVRRPQFCYEPQNLLERLPWDSLRVGRPTVLAGRRRENSAVFLVVCDDPKHREQTPVKPVERVGGQIGQTQKVTCEVSGGINGRFNGFRSRGGGSPSGPTGSVRPNIAWTISREAGGTSRAVRVIQYGSLCLARKRGEHGLTRSELAANILFLSGNV